MFARFLGKKKAPNPSIQKLIIQATSGEEKAKDELLRYYGYRNIIKGKIQKGLYFSDNSEISVKDYEVMWEYFQQAANNGDVVILQGLGDLFYNGRGVEKDLKLAAEWYSKGAKSNHLPSQRHYGDILFELKNYVDSFKYYEKIVAVQGEKTAEDFNKHSKDYFHYTHALYQLGYMSRRGFGTQKNAKKAVEFYQKCTALSAWNDFSAHFELVDMYENGDNGLEKDYRIARQWLQKILEHPQISQSLNKENKRRATEILHRLERLSPLPSEIKQTSENIKALTIKANDGDSKSQYDLAEAILTGKTGEDTDLCIVWLTKAAEKNYAPALHLLGDMFDVDLVHEKEDKKETDPSTHFMMAFKNYLQAAQHGYLDSFFRVGLYQANGRGFSTEANAVEWFQKISNETHRQVLEKYLKVDATTVINLAPSVTMESLPIGPEIQMKQVFFMVGFYYEHGFGVEKDLKQAEEWYLKAAEEGLAKAQCMVAARLEKNNNSHDLKTAFEWFHKAANQGNSEAQCKVASMFENGIGVTQDLLTAKLWYQKAALQGLATKSKIEDVQRKIVVQRENQITTDFSAPYPAPLLLHSGNTSPLTDSLKATGSTPSSNPLKTVF